MVIVIPDMVTFIQDMVFFIPDMVMFILEMFVNYHISSAHVCRMDRCRHLFIMSLLFLDNKTNTHYILQKCISSRWQIILQFKISMTSSPQLLYENIKKTLVLTYSKKNTTWKYWIHVGEWQMKVLYLPTAD